MYMSRRLEVKVEGSPTPKVLWYKQGVEIIPCQEFQIEYLEDNSSVLTVTEVYPDDAGEILCEAHNELGVATTTTVLEVPGNKPPRSQTAAFGWRKLKIWPGS